MLFWGIAGLVVLTSLVIVIAPMLRGEGRSERRASYDMQIYRDQLAEIDRDVARGVITSEEAENVRVEVARKLLAAADAEARESAAGTAPRRFSRAAGAAVGVVALLLTSWIYLSVGAPAMPDQPLAERLARQAEARANRPRQEAVETIVAENRPAPPAAAPAEDAALVDRLIEVLAARPDDLEGHRLLVRSLASLGRFPEAWRAQERVVAILGEAATGDELVHLAELMIVATDGYVSPEAEGALAEALGRDPLNAPGRYYSGLTLLQGGRPDLAYRLWSGLLEEGPPDAPWTRAIEAEIDDVALMAGLPPRGAPLPGMGAGPEAGTGPSLEGLGDDEQAMIDAMVATLGTRLAAEGGPPEDWARLIRSLGVLGRIGEAAAIWAEAQEVFEEDASALALLAQAARDARLVQ
jgi:cytochrome c-type biogenesis protein CcmH